MKPVREKIANALRRAAIVAYLGWDAGISWKPERGQIGWPWGGVQTPDEANDSCSRLEIIRKAHQLERNNWLALALGEIWVTYTVGMGLPIRAASSDKAWNARADENWARWCETPDLISKQDFDSWQCMVAWRCFFDGAGYIYKTGEKVKPFRPRVQFIEAAQVQTPPELSDRRDIFDGVERSPIGRKIAYYVKTSINGESSFARIPASDIIPICDLTRPGETHSFSYLSAVLEDIQDLKELAAYAMVKAKDAADITNVFTTEDGEVPTAESRRRAKFTVSTETASGTTTTKDRLQNIRTALGPRSIAIRTDEKVEQLRAESPNEIEQSHWNIGVERVCAGTRIPKVLVIPSSMQGTVVRAVLDHANTFFKSKSKNFQRAFVEVRRYVTDQESRFDVKVADKPADWQKFSIRHPRGCNVDIGRNSSAIIAECDAGLRTMTSVYEELGEDGWAAIDTIADEQAHIDEAAARVKISPDRIRKSIGDSLKLDMQQEALTRSSQDAIPA